MFKYMFERFDFLDPYITKDKLNLLLRGSHYFLVYDLKIH